MNARKNDWYWAVSNDGPAYDKFVIANGRAELWRRVRREIDPQDHCAWMPIHPTKPEPTIEDLFNLLLVSVPAYTINHNKFVLEAAQIPCFALFLRQANADLCNYVSNPAFPDAAPRIERYNSEVTKALGNAVSRTLGIEADWFEY